MKLFMLIVCVVATTSTALMLGPGAAVLVAAEQGVGLGLAGLGAPCIAAEVVATGVIATEAAVAVVPVVLTAAGSGTGAVIVGTSVAEAVVGAGVGSAVTGNGLAAFASGLLSSVAVSPAVLPWVLLGGVVVVGAADPIEIIYEPPADFMARPAVNGIVTLVMILGAIQWAQKIAKFVRKR
jgi:hypothetical protein